MLKQRVDAVDKVNKLFGLDIKVYLNPIIDSIYKVNTSDRQEVDTVDDAVEPVKERQTATVDEEVNDNGMV